MSALQALQCTLNSDRNGQAYQGHTLMQGRREHNAGRWPLPQSRCFHASADRTNSPRCVVTAHMDEQRRKGKGKESVSGDTPQTPWLFEEEVEEEHKYGTPRR